MNTTLKKPMAPASHPEPLQQHNAVEHPSALALAETASALAEIALAETASVLAETASAQEPAATEAPLRLANTAPAFRDAMAELAGGVCVITTLDGDTPTGLTVTSGFSVSMTPALFAICVDNGSRTLPALLRSESFVANVLDGESQHVAANFASSKVPNKFVSPQGPIESMPTPIGVPWLHRNSRAGVECEISQVIPAGDHTLIIGHVVGVQFPKSRSDAGSLAYLKREFHVLRSAS